MRQKLILRPRRLVIAASVAVLAIAAGVAYASIPGPDGVIHGCYDKKGKLRVVDSAATCRDKETALNWNQTDPAGPGTSGYAYYYNLSPGVVPIEAPITFDTNGPSSAGFTHVPGQAAIVVTTAGVYEASFVVSGVEPNQMAVFVNGSPVPGSIYGSGAGTQQNTGQVIFAAAAGDVITLVNHGSASAVTLQPLAGGTQPNVNASIMLKQLS